MGTIILIDGYNVIHSSFGMSKLLKSSKYQAQERLVSLVSKYCSWQDIEGYVVFDAYRRDCSASKEIISSRLKVVLTGRGETADSYIERFVSLNKIDYEHIYVITSDYSQRRTLEDEKVLFLSPQNFLKEIESCQNVLENYSSSLPKSRMRVFDCLKDEVREKLEKIRYELS